MPQSPPPGHRPQHHVGPDVADALRRAENAIKHMTWGPSRLPAPAGILRAYDGRWIDERLHRWTCTLCTWRAPDSVEVAEGAVTNFQEMLVVKLPRAVAAFALTLAAPESP